MLRFVSLGLLTLMLAGCGGSDANNRRDKAAWEAPELFSEVHQGFQGGRLVVDADERVLLAWSQDSHVWASASADGVNWDTPEQVDDAALRAGLTDVAMNASGKAALVWHAEETTPADYFKARLYSPLTGWDASAQFLDALATDGTGGAVAVNAAGDVMTVFARYDASGHVWARSYSEGSGWSGAAVRLDTLAGYSNYPSVALDDEGNATVVWEQWDGARNQALARRYIADVGWDATPTELDGSGDPGIDRIRVAIGADGDGLAYWTLTDRTAVMARRLVDGTWQAAETVATGTSIYEADARIAPDGRIVVTWTDGQDVHARICVDGIWDAAGTLVSDDAETVNLRTSVIAMDRTNGRAIVLWTRLADDDADGSAVWARRYDPVSGWSPVEEVVPWTPGILYDVDDAVLHDDGRVLAVLAGEDVTVWEYSTYLISYR